MRIIIACVVLLNACALEPTATLSQSILIFDTSCDDEQRAALNLAVVLAGSAIVNLGRYSNHHAAKDHRSWEAIFSYWNVDRFDFTDAVVEALQRCSGMTVTLRCDDVWCGEEARAVTRISPDPVISICDPFWNLLVFGIDSQAGALVHEISHVQSCGSTEDFTYCSLVNGINTCLLYALERPDDALGNADHYALYAETAGAIAWPDPTAQEASPDGGPRGQYADFPSVGDIRCDAAPAARGASGLRSVLLIVVLLLGALLGRGRRGR